MLKKRLSHKTRDLHFQIGSSEMQVSSIIQLFACVLEFELIDVLIYDIFWRDRGRISAFRCQQTGSKPTSVKNSHDGRINKQMLIIC